MTSIIASLRGSAFKSRGAWNAAHLKKGQGVILTREPTNEYHANAIEVHSTKGEDEDDFCGYLDAGSADILAPKMDAGFLVLANVICPPTIDRVGNQNYLLMDSCLIRCTILPPLSQIVKRKAKIDA